MGRLESLTAWALGRTPYEDEVAELPDFRERGGGAQQYNERGRPRNPETRRRERENVRTANEVMLVTGIVEDALTAKNNAKSTRQQKNRDTLSGLRLMELGRAALVGGVWGVLGLRRRVLLYKPYSELALVNTIRHENEVRSISNLMLSGLPAALACHVSDWVGFVAVDIFLAADEEEDTPILLWIKRTSQILLEAGLWYMTLSLRMFAILQQLHLISGSRLLPSFTSIIPFTAASPLQLPPPPSLNAESILSWVSAISYSAAPFLMILAHEKVNLFISRILYRPIYKSLPRPVGDSMFVGLSGPSPLMEFDTPDIRVQEERPRRGEDTPTLRALEGLPALERDGAGEARSTQQSMLDHGDESSEDGNDDMHQATLISFDVEATEAVGNSLGTWSAELRSANEPVVVESTKYRTTGLTLLPVILAAEGLREIFSGLLALPIEAVMVRVIARAYRRDAGLGVADLYGIGVKGFLGRESLVGAFAMQVVLTGVMWAGFTVTSQWLTRKRGDAEDKQESTS